VILRNINWDVPAGTSAAIIGPNGSGKSTLARVVMGQMWASSGEVSVLGEKFGECDLQQLRESIRLVQPVSVVEFDLDETTTTVVLTGYFGTMGLFHPVDDKMRAEAKRLINLVGLKKEENQLYKTLSNGERIRCLIARALVMKPRLLILDEPTAGLDMVARERVLATIAKMIDESENPPAVVMITHHVEELLPGTQHVLLLKDGKAAASGKPKDVLRSEILSDVYNFPVHVQKKGGRFWVQVKPEAWDGLVGKRKKK